MADNKDFFAPPTKEELDAVFAPPSKEEVERLKQPTPAAKDESNLPAEMRSGPSGEQKALESLGFKEDPSRTQAGLSGMAQGATFGFSDEMGAGGDVLGDIIQGKTGPTIQSQITGEDTSLSGKWRKYQKQRESANKTLSDAYPGTYMAGEVAGGLVTAPLMPELGAAKLLGGAGKALGLSGKVAPKLLAWLAGKSPQALEAAELLKAGKITAEAAEAMAEAAPKVGALSKIAGKAVGSAIEGAPIGAAYGVGTSKHGLGETGSTTEDLKNLGSDALGGAEYGSLGGMAIGGGLQAGKTLTSETIPGIAKNIDFFRKLGVASDLGAEGLNTHTRTAKNKANILGQEQIPAQTSSEMLGVVKDLGENISGSIEQATTDGVKINIDPSANKAARTMLQTFIDNPAYMDLLDPKAQGVLERMKQGSFGDLSPSEARALKDNLFEVSDKLSKASDLPTLSINKSVNTVAKSLDNALKTQVEGYAAANEQYNQFLQHIPETILQPGVALDQQTKSLSDIEPAARARALADKARHIFGSATMPGLEKQDPTKVGLAQLESRFNSLKEKMPDVAANLEEKVGGNVPDAYLNRADKMAVIQQMQGHHPHESMGQSFVGSLVNTGQGKAFTLANRWGALKNATSKYTTKPAGQLFTMGDDALMSLSQKLKSRNDKLGTYFGENLEKALTSKDQTARNAIFFRMLQDPNFRALLKDENM